MKADELLSIALGLLAALLAATVVLRWVLRRRSGAAKGKAGPPASDAGKQAENKPASHPPKADAPDSEDEEEPEDDPEEEPEDDPARTDETAIPGAGGGGSGAGAGDRSGSGSEQLPTTIPAVLQALQKVFDDASHPTTLLVHPLFQHGVRLLNDGGTSTEELLRMYTGPTVLPACLALEALAQRSDNVDVVPRILMSINTVAPWTSFFAARTIDSRAKEPVVAALLAVVGADWGKPPLLNLINLLLRNRNTPQEAAAFKAALPKYTKEQRTIARGVLAAADKTIAEPFLEQLQKWDNEHVDAEALEAIGHVWVPERECADTVALPVFVAQAKTVAAQLTGSPPRSVILVGEGGVGKTAIAKLVACELEREQWTVFAASAADVNAGMIYVGSLEERVNTLVKQLAGKKVIWFIPGFDELFWAGQHHMNPRGILDLIIPHIESGAIRVLGEVRTPAYDRLLQDLPKVGTLLYAHRVEPLDDAGTLELARLWAAKRAPPGSAPMLDDRALREAMQLAKQYLDDSAAPGMLMYLLEAAQRRRMLEGRADVPMAQKDLLTALSEMTGLPLPILDDAQKLDVAGLQAFFSRNVLGQPEAVECLVERVVLIKAGVTDPTRPAGVFLFVGPTGTGKTQIAKTLAEYLFGSPERMIRIDMSELQEPGSVNRLIGGGDVRMDGRALVDRIRAQPFSVVLLDEFEKSHPAVHDLFLQLFDDGRLTDRRGSTADFRHCIVIMTSNLGATVPVGSGIGFAGETGAFAPNAVRRAVDQTFRREFVNRIDRVVVFHPLSRAVMRDLLRKELRDVLQRRGLRNRQWAIELDDSAVNFLLERGFSPDLGARPLKRAVEEYVLSPLAFTIVKHEVPEGDQFLFVRSDGNDIEVEFVDPDAADGSEAGAQRPADSDSLPLESLVVAAYGTPEEVALLEAEHERLVDRIESSDWEERKATALDALRAEGFWTSPNRFAVLGLAEYMDRIETGLETAHGLLRRLGVTRQPPRARFRPDLVQRLAQQIYLLRSACEGLASNQPRDAFVLVTAAYDGTADASLADSFAARLGEMYRAWASKRRMHLQVLSERQGNGTDSYQLRFAVSGYAAYAILQAEDGSHLLEVPESERGFLRARAIVHVVPQPDEPATGAAAILAQAVGALEAKTVGRSIVRRYREAPSPLVRDSVHEWRTGRLDLVFGGDFDVLGGWLETTPGSSSAA